MTPSHLPNLSPSTAPTLPANHPLLRGLNPEQLAAVTLPQGHALILAGAGSGKTRVLTTRIAWLLHTGQASAGHIMAVTFTNKAAKEMQARLATLVPFQLRGMWMGTFHGLCNRLLRAHHQAAGLAATFQILDVQDQQAAIKRLLKQHNMDAERFPPKQLAWFFASCKEDGLRPKDVVATNPEMQQKVALYQLYEDQCQREGVVDFAELLRDHHALRQHYQQRFRYLLVDEFQDTNRLQYQWLKLLAGESEGGHIIGSTSVLAVGDDDQSIYAFRGARVGNMQDFLREFKVQHHIKLERNYRSHGHILDCANALIEHNSQRLGKNLSTDQGAGEPVRIQQTPTDLDEARWLVEEVQALTRQDGLQRQEIAVLYRSNAQSRVIESRLFNAGIPYRVYGGMRFFERAEVKHALAYLRLLENPQDDTSYTRVVNFPTRGIGTRSLESLQQQARQAGCSLHNAASLVSGAAGAKLQGFNALLDVMREAVAGQSLGDTIAHVLQASGLEAHYQTDKEGQERLENLQELIRAAESFVQQEGFGKDAIALPLDETAAAVTTATAANSATPAVDLETGETLSPLQAFLVHAALEAGDNQAQAGQDAVQLMTVHASKGLEFDAVFIVGLEEGLFPHDNALSDKDGLEEERRLMYVAITRARQRLYLSHAHSRMLHGRTSFNLPSRFLDELPPHCLHHLLGTAGFAKLERSDYVRGGGISAGAQSFAHSLLEKAVAAPAASAAAGSGAALRKGQQVFHAKFGEGQVLAVEGQGADARAHIHFVRHGAKWLALAIAKLTVVA
ncbi:MAG: UvrD-helicase domain-containing protein [Comamonas sp.]|nr:UvrD-helicase domain-containing protein [Comamonas sp.]